MTIALDTNILLRLVLNDDAAQLEKVMGLLKSGVGYVQDTVVVELEWVLRSFCRFSIEQISDAMMRLAQNTDIELESPERLERALVGYAAGIEFTDAFHLAGAQGHSAFLTFDKDLLKRGPRVFDRPELIEP